MISSFVRTLISVFKARRKLALENVALRQQLAVLRRSVKRTRLSNVDCGFWVLLRRIWTDWESVLVIVKPETVVRWHRCGFRRYCQVDEKLADRPPRYWARVRREPAMLGIRNGCQPQLDSTLDSTHRPRVRHRKVLPHLRYLTTSLTTSPSITVPTQWLVYSKGSPS